MFGILQRSGEVFIQMLANVKQATIEPLIRFVIQPGSSVYTDEYDIYARLEAWGYPHKSVCHGRGEYARDDDGDGFHEVHVNTIEGFWSIFKRGIVGSFHKVSRKYMPLYVAEFQFRYNNRGNVDIFGAAIEGC